jgi:protein SCO1
MKTTVALLISVLATAGLARGADVKPASCCPPPAAAKPSCCDVKKPSCCTEEKPAAPLAARSLYQLDATWTSDEGQPVKLATLRGQPVVLAMFFATCEYACPVLVHDMQRLRELLPAGLREQARFVLVTFDVERDTTAALKAYRERAGLDANTWTLLRADADTVQDLAMLLGVKYKQDARGQFSHSNLITVLNAEGEIVHQRAGLMGDMSDAAKAVTLAAR